MMRKPVGMGMGKAMGMRKAMMRKNAGTGEIVGMRAQAKRRCARYRVTVARADEILHTPPA